MQLTTGINHVAVLTTDLDRLKAFYEHAIGANTLFDLEDRGVRHAMIMLGDASGVHAFQVDAGIAPPGWKPMFARGRLDHLAITARDGQAFDELRRRAMATGADAELVDYGPILAFNVRDPDGGEVEICVFKPGVDLTTPPPDRQAAADRIGAQPA
jgi:catechol 2,3-dioxygenase-like lactoylglutathione lyase family enzyme